MKSVVIVLFTAVLFVSHPDRFGLFNAGLIRFTVPTVCAETTSSISFPRVDYRAGLQPTNGVVCTINEDGTLLVPIRLMDLDKFLKRSGLSLVRADSATNSLDWTQLEYVLVAGDGGLPSFFVRDGQNMPDSRDIVLLLVQGK